MNPVPDHDSDTTSSSTADATALALGAAVLLPAVLAGCGGGGGGAGGGGDTTALTITAIEVMAVTDVAATVTVDGAIQPAGGGVVRKLDGKPGRERDPGSKGATSSRRFLVHADGATQDLDITVTFNPSPNDVALLALPGFTTYAQARHLTARLGFGGSWDDLTSLMGMTYDQAVDFLVAGMRTTPMQRAPAWINDTILTWQEFSALSPEAQEAYNARKWPRLHELKKWWLHEIVQTTTPLTERLVAFWGNHFVVNIEDVEEPQLAWSWLSLLRTHAGGNLRDFIHAMCLHPEMLIYLDNASNVKSRAPGVPDGAFDVPSNENFGRELLELFMLGERTPAGAPTYTEDDVLAVARAFTGHNIDGRKAYLYRDEHHDKLPLTILGVGPQEFGTGSGNITGIIDAVLSKVMPTETLPRTAQLVVEKLWAEFIGTTPTTSQVNTLAQVLVDNDWELRPLYQALFKHNEFKAGATDLSRKLLKTPLEFIAGLFRSLEVTPNETDNDWVSWAHTVWNCGEIDQNPLCPPIVKGWLGGTNWINTKSLVSRHETTGGYGWFIHNEIRDENLPRFLLEGYETFLLAVPRYFPEPDPVNEEWEQPIGRRVRDIIRDPAYHMK